VLNLLNGGVEVVDGAGVGAGVNAGVDAKVLAGLLPVYLRISAAPPAASKWRFRKIASSTKV
jgi:hypothetical protein